jgi:hypothetical protein
MARAPTTSSSTLAALRRACGRRAALRLVALGGAASGLLLAGCAGEDEGGPVTRPGPPPTYGHLIPLRLDVAGIEVVDQPPPGPAGRVMPPAPVNPAEAMAQMARDRLVAAGSSGRGRFTIEQASLVRNELAGGAFSSGGERLVCELRCRLEVVGGTGGERAGFVEAQARRVLSAPGQSSAARRAAAADRVVRAAMDSLNVELEYQIRRNLRGWLLTSLPPGVAPPPPPVGAAGPGGAGGAAAEEIMREDLPRDGGEAPRAREGGT